MEPKDVTSESVLVSNSLAVKTTSSIFTCVCGCGPSEMSPVCKEKSEKSNWLPPILCGADGGWE